MTETQQKELEIIRELIDKHGNKGYRDYEIMYGHNHIVSVFGSLENYGKGLRQIGVKKTTAYRRVEWLKSGISLFKKVVKNRLESQKREHPLTVRVSFHTLDWLHREAHEQGKTVSTIVNEILLNKIVE